MLKPAAKSKGDDYEKKLKRWFSALIIRGLQKVEG